MLTNRKCPVCGSPVKGRSDKLFCSTKCKSINQYETRQVEEGFYLQVDRQLKINRKLLKRYNRSGYTTMRRAELITKGFDPKFFTHHWKNKKGDVYLFCYDYGFLPLERDSKDKYLIVKWQDYMK
ncbi:DUF2116 family Zn-ribbon domain-containing protein [Kriegella aquimaris]|uniref:Uncharacterized protein containing a Zn-ribbon n=1 Tax=Kriegella aquimaris TaxID=192904 RepID=A0A1G9Z287_9FLAO|nr:DUF2116 family Zn-ribbon domain-containing protein [Kriegella aquimaris]SDN15297.1 Uncharacterized protein containing a Zn-ribbon [Kriegella aquimaris]